jgi:hypothetical protein
MTIGLFTFALPEETNSLVAKEITTPNKAARHKIFIILTLFVIVFPTHGKLSVRNSQLYH